MQDAPSSIQHTKAMRVELPCGLRITAVGDAPSVGENKYSLRMVVAPFNEDPDEASGVRLNRLATTHGFLCPDIGVFGRREYVVEEPVFRCEATRQAWRNLDDELVDNFHAQLGRVRSWRLCMCGDFLRFEGQQSCFGCALADALPAHAEDFCCVCHEPTVQNTGCCDQPLHTRCRAQSQLETCPMCTNEGDLFVA